MSFLPQLRVVPGLGSAWSPRPSVLVFGFFFSVVSSRITGELGSSSNPISGMAIATLMGVCVTFVSLGWTGHAYTAAALSIGAIVCIAASNAGTTSQDLKTSFLVGGTPWKQQVAIMVGVRHQRARDRLDARSSSTGTTPGSQEAAYDVTLTPRARSGDAARPGRRALPGGAGGGAGGHPRRHLPRGRRRAGALPGAGGHRLRPKAPAPQATLMSLVTKGILTQQLPWGLVLLGVFTSILMEIVGVPALAFAVGMYLPLESTTPIFLGGLVRKARRTGGGARATESDAGPGVL